MPAPVKAYKTYDEQVDVLASRGMSIGDRDAAIKQLQHINYYRLSGYWYSFRRQGTTDREDSFYAGTAFADVISLYAFDASLRSATFSALTPIELALRALIGHALGTIDECAHLKPSLLGPRASQGPSYATWMHRYKKALADSKEDFVKHHHAPPTASCSSSLIPAGKATAYLPHGSSN